MGRPLRVDPAEDYSQMVRLAEFRQRHPDVIIGDLGFTAWQARIPEAAGETVVTRRTLPEQLDRLGELLG